MKLYNILESTSDGLCAIHSELSYENVCEYLISHRHMLFNKYVQRNSIEYWDAHYFLKYETLDYKMK